jgi:hypothetical protein
LCRCIVSNGGNKLSEWTDDTFHLWWFDYVYETLISVTSFLIGLHQSQKNGFLWKLRQTFRYAN